LSGPNLLPTKNPGFVCAGFVFENKKYQNVSRVACLKIGLSDFRFTKIGKIN
jgi:hypothetical protein